MKTRRPGIAIHGVMAWCTVLIFIPIARADVVGFDLTLTATTSSPDFGTGVMVGDVFAGRMFFDEVDLTPDGIRTRSIIPGGDFLDIAGISFDTLLSDSGWSFEFIGGGPVCFALAVGCAGEQLLDPPKSPAIGFGLGGTTQDPCDGWAADGGANHLFFTYKFSVLEKLWDQSNYDVGATAFVDQAFGDFPDFDSYLVTDIDTGDDGWVISSVTTYFTNANGWANAGVTQGRLNIFPKTGNLPDGGDDPGAGDIVDITISDLGDTIAIVAGGLSIELAGEHWVGLTPLANFGEFGQEFHRGAPIMGVDTAWRNPGGGFGVGTDWSDTGILGAGWVGAFDAAINISGVIDDGGGNGCTWDLDGDDSVSTGDLILLLGSWGDPYGTADLIALLGAWGPCP